MTATLPQLPQALDYWHAVITSRAPAVGDVATLTPAEFAELQLLRRSKKLPRLLFGRRVQVSSPPAVSASTVGCRPTPLLPPEKAVLALISTQTENGEPS